MRLIGWRFVVSLALTLNPVAGFSNRGTEIRMKMSAPSSSLKIAVIGGGAAGLAATRALSRNGIHPVVLEKELWTGGVWRHIPNDPKRPMYQGLRTNLPREVMAYREKPWGSNGVGKSFVTHGEVLSYLRDYENDFDLSQYISYGCEVQQLTVKTDSWSLASPCTVTGDESKESWPRIQLKWKETREDKTIREHSDTFDAVCICNGHYAASSIPDVPGLTQNFKGTVVHSIEYDDPSIFANQTVLCVGGRASGSDLAREISGYAEKVYLSDSSCPPLEDGEPRTLGNITWVPRTLSVETDSSIRFDDSCSLFPKDVDTIIFCSGYDYSFPFINEKSHLDLDVVPGERRVMPLYEQLWHARYPNLAFVGLPHSVVPFPFFEFQSEAVVAQLLGVGTLPTLQDRLESARRDAGTGGSKQQSRVQDTHYLGGAQWDYCRRMAKLAGLYSMKVESYIATNKAIYDHSGTERKHIFPGGPDTYRSTCYARDDENQSFTIVAADKE